MRAFQTKIADSVPMLTNSEAILREKPYCSSVIVNLPYGELRSKHTVHNSEHYESQRFKLAK